MKPGDYPLYSVHSRVAARKLLKERKAMEDDRLRFVVKSIMDDSPIKFDALAEQQTKGMHKEPGSQETIHSV